MPCRDYMDDRPDLYHGAALANKDAEIARLTKKLNFIESALCGFMNHCSGLVPTYIDWNEQGVTPAEIADWFEQHQAADAIARKKKMRERNLAKLRKLHGNVFLESELSDELIAKLLRVG